METNEVKKLRKNCVFIGRFQPFHNGHLQAVKWILAQNSGLSIVIGSLQEYSTKINPLAFFERKEIIERVFKAEGVKGVSIIGLPDFKNDAAWGKKLREIVKIDPNDVSIVTLNPWTERAAKAAGFSLAAHPVFCDNLSATKVREQIFLSASWENLVPRETAAFLLKSGALEKIRMAQVPLEQRISRFIADKIKESQTRGAILAVSGGIDSALVAAIAKKTLGKKVRFIFLPFFKTCPFRKNVALLQNSLKIEVKRFYLGKVIEAFEKILPDGGNLAYGNLKPRIRMAVLYYLANTKKLLVLGTTNKSELEIGYFTKYGDGGVDIEPIADLYKTEVFELARELKVPIDILETAPTAALWPGQTDEKELGVSYFELDTVLKMSNLGFGKEDIANLTDIKSEKMEKIFARKIKNSHKLATPYICKIK